MLEVQKLSQSKTSCLQRLFVRCVYVYSSVCVCVKCEWCVRWCSCEAAVVLQSNYSLSAAAGGYSQRCSPVDSEPPGCWIRQQIDHSWHWPTQPHSTLGEQKKKKKRKGGRKVERGGNKRRWGEEEEDEGWRRRPQCEGWRVNVKQRNGRWQNEGWQVGFHLNPANCTSDVTRGKKKTCFMLAGRWQGVKRSSLECQLVLISIRLRIVLDCRERRGPVPPWYLPTAMTCFAGFTYGNASSGEVRGPFISPPGHKVDDWHTGLPATVKGSNSTLLCTSHVRNMAQPKQQQAKCLWQTVYRC